MSETSKPSPAAEIAKPPSTPAVEPPELSGAEVKRQNKAEKAARRAQEKQKKQGTGSVTVVISIQNS